MKQNQENREVDRLMFAIADGKPEGIKQALSDLRCSQANEIQIGGEHYKEKTIQPWDYIAANSLGYFEGNIVKYVSRWKEKGGVDDLRKARHYLDKLIELKDNAA